MNTLMELEKSDAKDERLDHFDVGDMVDVHVWITEGDKRRIQRFSGLVTAIKHGRGIRGTFTVRRIVAGLGVERIFPFHSPNLDKVEVTRYGKVRRSKLYYLRDRIGKEALKVKELIGGKKPERVRRVEEEAEKDKKKVKRRGKKAKAERRKAAEAKVSKSTAKKKKKKRRAAKKKKDGEG